MAMSYRGYDVNCITMIRDSLYDQLIGTVIFNADGKVTKAGNGAEIFAVAIANRNSYITVQTRGYVELHYTGAVPTYGRCKLACDGNGGVTQSSSASPHTVLKIDEANKMVGFII